MFLNSFLKVLGNGWSACVVSPPYGQELYESEQSELISFGRSSVSQAL